MVKTARVKYYVVNARRETTQIKKHLFKLSENEVGTIVPETGLLADGQTEKEKSWMTKRETDRIERM